MSTLGKLLKVAFVAASMFVAATAHASDVSSDRAQAAANARPSAEKRHTTSGADQPDVAKACRCAVHAPAAAPKSLLDDPNITGYRGG